MKCLKDRKMDFQGIQNYILRIRLYLEKDNQEFWKKNDSHKKIYSISIDNVKMIIIFFLPIFANKP